MFLRKLLTASKMSEYNSIKANMSRLANMANLLAKVGILIKNIQYHSSQPWPFPSSLMVGFYAEAKSTDIKINKNEIEDVNWFSKEEMLYFSDQGKFLPREISISRRLIDDWINK